MSLSSLFNPLGVRLVRTTPTTFSATLSWETNIFDRDKSTLGDEWSIEWEGKLYFDSECTNEANVVSYSTNTNSLTFSGLGLETTYYAKVKSTINGTDNYKNVETVYPNPISYNEG